MNLLLQLLPYTLFAGLVLAATGFYVLRTSQERLTRRLSNALPSDPVGESAVFPEHREVPARPAAPAPGKTQILRLHELGIPEPHIASALQVPLQEVQLVVRLDKIRRPRPARSEIPQPTIVE
jgi:hypothetical protein